MSSYGCYRGRSRWRLCPCRHEQTQGYCGKGCPTSLKFPLSDLYSSQLQRITAGPYRELITYHAACEDAASAVTSGREWFPSWEGRLTGIWTLKTRGMLNLLCMLCTTQDPVSRTLVEESGPTSRRFGPWCLWNYLHRSASVLAHHPTAAATLCTGIL
jgi:hypothetical protein